MKRMMLTGMAGLSCLALMAAVAPAKAMMIAPAPVAQRVAQADCVVVGKVTSLEDKKVAANRFKGDTAKYTIAVVKIADGILGTKGLTHVRVAFIEPPPPPAPGAGPAPGGRPILIRPGRRFPQVNLTPGLEACLFLKKVPEKPFYTAQMYFDVVNKAGNANFAKEVEEAKRYAKLLAQPEKSLKAEKAEDRYLAAYMLLARIRKTGYVNINDRNQKTEKIDAKQSQLILEAIADADWSNRNPTLARMNPYQTFNMLGLQPADGWTPPRDYREVPEAAKQWLKDHASTYRIKRVVPATEKSKG